MFIIKDDVPENILISSDGMAKLIDFGIARRRKENQTRDTRVLGTVGYAAPEQYGIFQTDITADFYAFGIVLNEMLTGKVPNEELTQNNKLKKIIRKCIQIDPVNRYESAEKIRKDLASGVSLRKEMEEKRDASILPGFRSNIKWRKYLASIGYVFMALSTVLFIAEVAPNPLAMLLEGIAVLIYIWMVFLVATNFGRWDRWLFPFSRLPKELNVTIRIVVCALLFGCGIQLENYIKYTMLHLPKP